MENFNFDELCVENITCKKEKCQLKHPRRFAGLCIVNLKGKCENQKECQLFHFQNKKMQKQGLGKISINGYCYFNLCKQNNCKDKNNCRYLHPEWNIKYCIQCLYDPNQCEIEHDENDKDCFTVWDQIQKKVYQEFNYELINPENLCAKLNCKCELKHSKTLLESGVCIQYFQGNCPNIKCPQKHLTWEQYRKNRNNIQYLEADLYPCSKEDQKKLQEIREHEQKILETTAIINLRKQIKVDHTIDVVFIVDCTGSMQSWIDKCKNQIEMAAKEFIQKREDEYIIRLSFVGYRDYEDKDRTVVLGLTENLEQFTQFLQKIEASGGEDEAEDLFSGLKKALELKFADSDTSILVTFLFADAPCHGKQYHNGANDNHADKIKEGKLEKCMKKYSQLKLNNLFCCIRLNKSTEKMFQIMQQQMPKQLIIVEEIEAQNIKYFFQKTIALSIQNSLLSNDLQQFQATLVQTRYLAYESQEGKFNKQFWQNFPQNVNKYKREYLSTIRIHKNPLQLEELEAGTQSQVFLLYDIQYSVRYVTKINKNIIEEFKKNNKISDQSLTNHQNEVIQKFYDQTKAQFLAKLYRNKTSNLNGAPPIFFVQPVIIELNVPFQGLNILYAETYIKLPEVKWQKYSNNGIYQDPQYYYFSSFSHFTYEESCQQFILTDLQGKGNIFSDPAFHNQNIYGSQLNQTTDLQFQGIAEFQEKQHPVCSFICNYLGYKSFSNKSDDAKSKNQWKPTEENQISAVCESCNSFLTITMKQYKDGYHKECDNCKSLQLKTKKSFCQCCKKIFDLPLDLSVLRHTNISGHKSGCQECKKSCLNRLKQGNNKCLYCSMSCTVELEDIYGQSICKRGLQYLKSLCCKRCSKQNSEKEIISKEDYEKGNFICKNCKVKK